MISQKKRSLLLLKKGWEKWWWNCNGLDIFKDPKEGIFPLPAEDDTKVVNQLTQVANDSEEKVSQILMYWV